MPGLWERLRRVLTGGVRHRVTAAGLLFTAFALLVGLAAFLSANNLLFLLFAAMLSTLLVSGFVSRLSLAGLELDLSLPEHITARRPAPARILVRNTKFLMPSFSMTVEGDEGSGLEDALYFPVIPGRARVEETVNVLFRRRGRHRSNSFQFSTRFPFGFTERRITVTLRRELLVYPCVDPQEGFEHLLASLTGEIQAYYRGRGHDFYRIRPYEPLESARHVDWKATAHTGNLQVREFARDQEHLVEVLLDLDAPPARRAWFEQAVDCCAFLIWHLAAAGARIHLRTQDAEFRVPEAATVFTLLRYLALVQPRPGVPPIAGSCAPVFRLAFHARAEDPYEASRSVTPSTWTPTGV